VALVVLQVNATALAAARQEEHPVMVFAANRELIVSMGHAKSTLAIATTLSLTRVACVPKTVAAAISLLPTRPRAQLDANNRTPAIRHLSALASLQMMSVVWEA
jgi:hypothetical protein